MPIEVTARHMEASDALQEYARSKAAQLAADFPRVEHVHVTLNQEKRSQIAAVFVQGRNHTRVEAEEASDNMRASIDAAMEKAARQLRRVVERVHDHKTAMKNEEYRRGLDAAGSEAKG